MKEEWRDIEGYEGIYQVSSHGRVRSLDRILADGRKIKGKNRIPWLNNVRGKHTYHTIVLCHEGERESFYVHHLVAEAFIPKIEGRTRVEHIDKNGENNHIQNLKWSSAEEISNNQETKEKWVVKQPKNNHRSKPVVGVKIKTEKIVHFPSLMEAARNGFSPSNINKSVKGDYSHHKGYKWYYAEDFYSNLSKSTGG